ncbi:MAG: TrmH family RNA methyltransferase [Planctomycetaceae bacterium]
MPLIPIASPDDPRLDPYRQLKQASDSASGFQPLVAEGEKLVRRLLESACPIHSLVVTPVVWERLAPDVPPHLPVYQLETPAVSQLVGFSFHRGALAHADPPPEPRLPELLQQVAGAADGLVVLCPELRDPTNLGTILRTAASLNVDFVVAGRQGVWPFSRRVLRTSMGSVLKIPVVQTDDVATTAALFRAAGFELVATVLDDQAEDLAELVPHPRRVLLLGNEDAGLAHDCLSNCDRRVTIPMSHGVDSLNVAVAAGIFLYHCQRTRTNRQRSSP